MTLPTSRQLASYTMGQQHPITQNWTTPARRIALLAEEHRIDIELATDDQLTRMRRDRFAPDAPIDLMRNVWLPTAAGLSVMLSIRYEGGDPALPFVDVSATNRPMVHPEDVTATARAASARFGALGPRYLRWWSAEPLESGHDARADKRFLAAPLAALADHETPAELALHPSPGLNDYRLAAEAYASIDRVHPDHRWQARLESFEDLTELQRDGLLFDVLLHGSWAGYVAAEPGHRLGLTGYKVAEVVLAERARGQGYGRYLSALLSQALAGRAAPADVLIGTVHADNTGARRAALIAGRQDVGGWLVRPLAG